MRLSSTPLILGFIFASSIALAVPSCTPGKGLDALNSACHTCTAGTYSPGGKVQCIDCIPGQGSDDGAASCTTCSAGTYSIGGTPCASCPAGTASRMDGATACIKCGPGSFAPAGSKGCCTCCAGFKCPNAKNKSAVKCASGRGSEPGSDSCDNNVHLMQTNTCAISNGYCPATTQLGPSSVPTKKKRTTQCPRGHTACPHWSGRGGWDCVDTSSSVDSCGGCLSISSSFDEGGVDCTTIPNVSVVSCQQSQCVIERCRKYFEVSDDGRSCVREDSHRELVAVADMFFPYKIKRSRL